jgi:RND family efflux transporter MFP subunit
MLLSRSHAAVAAVVAMAVASFGCSRSSAGSPPPPASSAATGASSASAPIRFSKVEARTLPRTLEVSGTLDADERSEVAAQTGGAVVKVEVDVGSRVKEGDVLVRLDGRDAALRAASASASATQQSARLGLKSGDKFDPLTVPDVRAAKEAMDLAVTDADRTKALFEGGSVSQAAWDQARSQAERARAQYDVARNSVEQAWAGLLAAQAQARLAQKAQDDTVVRAPFAGAVVEKRIAPGEFAAPGRVVVILVRDNPLRFRMDIPETDVSEIALGKRVELTVAAYPGRKFSGEIKRIGASLKQASRTLPVEAEIQNDGGELHPGFFARAQVAVAQGEVQALLVPKAAIGQSGSTSRLFVRAGDRVLEKLVTVGRDLGDLVEVRGQIAAGEEVALDRVDSLTDGAEVTPAK